MFNIFFEHPFQTIGFMLIWHFSKYFFKEVFNGSSGKANDKEVS